MEQHQKNILAATTLVLLASLLLFMSVVCPHILIWMLRLCAVSTFLIGAAIVIHSVYDMPDDE